MGRIPYPYEAPTPEVIVQCPPLKHYAPDTTKRAAKELRALPPGAATPGMIRDYGLLRRQCAETAPPPSAVVQ